MTENDRILIGRKNSFIQSVSRMVSKAGGAWEDASGQSFSISSTVCAWSRCAAGYSRKIRL